MPNREREELAGSFLGHDLGALERLLHDSIIVQPPAPDRARQGAEAIQYVVDLAENSAVSESRFWPHVATSEGPFVFEQGIWLLRAGNEHHQGPYALRWRRTPEGWKVTLWRWSRFR